MPKRQVLERDRTVSTAHEREGSKQDEQDGEHAVSYLRWVRRGLVGLGQILANHNIVTRAAQRVRRGACFELGTYTESSKAGFLAGVVS